MHHDTLLYLDSEPMPDRHIALAEKVPQPNCRRIVAISFVKEAIGRSPGFKRDRDTSGRSGSDRDCEKERLIHGFWKHRAPTQPHAIT